MKKIWNSELDSYLKANYGQLSDEMLAAKIKFKYGINFTAVAIKSRRSVLKLQLKKGYRRPIKYTDEVINYILKNYEGKSNITLANELNEKFNIDTNNDKICMVKANLIRRYGLNTRSGINPGCYPKGNIPINKGSKGMFNIGGNKTSFKKGNKSYNWVPIGTERIGKDGYVEIKIRDGQLQHNWEGKHRVLYRKFNGEILKGNIIIFADGDIRNFDKENLISISRNEHARLNQNNLRFNNIESTKSAINIAKIIIKTSELKNARKK